MYFEVQTAGMYERLKYAVINIIEQAGNPRQRQTASGQIDYKHEKHQRRHTAGSNLTMLQQLFAKENQKANCRQSQTAHHPQFKYIVLPLGVLTAIMGFLGVFQFFGHDLFTSEFGKKLIIPGPIIPARDVLPKSRNSEMAVITAQKICCLRFFKNSASTKNNGTIIALKLPI